MQHPRLTLRTERFAAEVMDTIYTYRMLDERFARRRVRACDMPPLPPFARSYLEYRVHNSGDGSAHYSTLRFFRAIIRDVVAENETLQYEDCTHLLCGLITEGGSVRVSELFRSSPENHLSLPVATYVDDVAFGKPILNVHPLSR